MGGTDSHIFILRLLTLHSSSPLQEAIDCIFSVQHSHSAPFTEESGNQIKYLAGGFV